VAGLGRKIFAAGEILTAADLQGYAVDQSVMVFDDATARTAAIPSPTEGMVTYRKDTKLVEAFTGSAFTPVGRILQVVSVAKTNFFSASSTSFVDVSDLSVSITPSSTSSKVLVFGDVVFSASDGTGFLQLVRGSTNIYTGTGGSTDNATKGVPIFGFGNRNQGPNAITFLDQPNTTGATTYKFQVKCSGAGQTIFVNRTAETGVFGYASSITVMEVAG
jgi:hypothetical protein